MKHVLGLGMQSGGTTVISAMWFRRDDTDGCLDIHNPLYPLTEWSGVEDNINIFHQKLTINKDADLFNIESFKEELVRLGAEDVSWYLIVRNPYDVVASLKSKEYGGHIKLKLLNFMRHYRKAIKENVPIISYEEFVERPLLEMGLLYQQLGVEEKWEKLNKPIGDKNYMRFVGNLTFLSNPNVIKKIKQDHSNLGMEDLKMINEVCGELIDAYTYSL